MENKKLVYNDISEDNERDITELEIINNTIRSCNVIYQGKLNSLESLVEKLKVLPKNKDGIAKETNISEGLIPDLQKNANIYDSNNNRFEHLMNQLLELI